jgi:hypothetical protein
VRSRVVTLPRHQLTGMLISMRTNGPWIYEVKVLQEASNPNRVSVKDISKCTNMVIQLLETRIKLGLISKTALFTIRVNLNLPLFFLVHM